jgi:FixJ family two-component response regulator
VCPGHQGGAVDFLRKPGDEAQLLAAIAIALAQDTRTRERQRSHAELRQQVARLTPRELEVMSLVVTGLMHKDIAYILGTTEKTIKTHRARLKEKMQALSLADLVRMATIVGMNEPQSA